MAGKKIPTRKNAPGAGRPVEYDDDIHPALVIEACARPRSMAHLAGEIGISKDTLYEWRKYPKFSDAFKQYKRALEEMLLEKAFEIQQNSKDRSAPMLMFMMKNMVGWKDKDESEYKAEAEAQAQAQVKYSKALTREEKLALARRKK